MTNKEAINWIINITADIGKSEHRDLWHYEQALSEIREMLEEQSEPCEDAVSRTDVFNAVRGEERGGYVDETVECMLKVMSDLPPVTPERKTGKWEIYVISPFDGEGCRCSECKYEGAPYWDYCPNCGAKMKEGDQK